MQQKTCCLIGHQDLQDYNLEKINIVLEEKIKQLADKGVEFFVSSCRTGFEMFAALKVQEMGKKLIVIDPYEDHDFIRKTNVNDLIIDGFQDNPITLPTSESAEQRSKRELDIYPEVKERAESVLIAVEKDKGTLLGQHVSAIEISNYVLPALNEKDFGSTRTAVKYAKTKEKEIIFIEMESLQKDLKKISPEENWETRKEYIYNYSVSFSPKELNNFARCFGVDSPLNFEGEECKIPIAPEKEENYNFSKDIAFDIAKKANSKLSIIKHKNKLSNIIELESDVLIFKDSRAKRLLTELIDRSDKFVLKNNENGNVSINAQFLLYD